MKIGLGTWSSLLRLSGWRRVCVHIGGGCTSLGPCRQLAVRRRRRPQRIDWMEDLKDQTANPGLRSSVAQAQRRRRHTRWQATWRTPLATRGMTVSARSRASVAGSMSAVGAVADIVAMFALCAEARAQGKATTTVVGQTRSAPTRRRAVPGRRAAARHPLSEGARGARRAGAPACCQPAPCRLP